MPKTRQHRVLIVDDDVDERFLTERVFRKLEGIASVNLVGSGNEAIAYMIGEDKFADRTRFPFPTLIVTDLKMQNGDGFHVLEFIQNNPAWSVIPRVVLSSSGDADDVRTAFCLGASVYHVKPTGSALDELLRSVVEYWARSEVPPVDENGRMLRTSNPGRLGARYAQPEGGKSMVRPKPRQKPQ